ncbi:Aste57867_12094 [Aphanomyces stellatus]|uniref:Aste57867_12094 protein n=1 Tax=Aphanomyces stellatus TaxID=120398 RepID=A0A485KV90_9STRA|nr:hypothetical protein As57867_012049 [Aphanomyces stellatus]VFT88949.1 Aste57867_12094 [Aphanomyces stellatus]
MTAAARTDSSLFAIYASAAVVAILVGLFVGWKKPQFMWPYIMFSCAATATIVIVVVSSPETLATLILILLLLIGLAVAFRGAQLPRVAVFVSAAVVLSFCVGVTLPVFPLFVTLSIASSVLVVLSTFLWTPLGLFFVGAASPIGVVDALYNVICQHHMSVFVAYATETMTIEMISVVAVAFVLALICGVVAMRNPDGLYRTQMTCATGAFIASFGCAGFISMTFDNLTIAAFVWTRFVVGAVLFLSSWYVQSTALLSELATPVEVALPTKETPSAPFGQQVLHLA